jgi:aarF domain-containing kinase
MHCSLCSGEESKATLDAHVQAGMTVGTPFGSKGTYDFGSHGQLTQRVRDLGAKMLQHRLVAPPVEAYSLHRRLSGAFLANIRLRARVPCSQLFDEIFKGYKFEENNLVGAKNEDTTALASPPLQSEKSLAAAI